MGDSHHSVTWEVVDAVADADGVGVRDLPVLYDAVDIDAVEDLFAREEPALTAFYYNGYEVVIRQQENREERTVHLRPQHDED